MVGRPTAASALLALVLLAAPIQGSEPYGMPMPVGINGQVCVMVPWESYGCSGAGVPDATVRVTGSGMDVTVRTDPWGSFWVEESRGGTYEVEVTRQGFEAVRRSVDTAQERQVWIALPPLKVPLSGQVLGEEGQGLEGATVRICCAEDIKLTTGADGMFEATVTAGQYSLHVEAPGHQAQSFDVFADGNATLVATLHPAPERDVRLEGTVRDQDGDPVAGAMVWVEQYQCCAEETVYPVCQSMEGIPCPPAPIYECYNDYGCGSAPVACRVDPSGAEECYVERPYSHDRYMPGHNVGLYESVVTDAQGHYVVDVYPAGEVQLRVEHPDAAPHHASVWVPAEGSLVHDLEVLRYPSRDARLTGRVVDAVTGNGIASYGMSVDEFRFGRSECMSDMGAWSDGYATVTAAPYSPYAYPHSTSYSPYHGGGYSGPYGDYGERHGHYGCALAMQPDGSFTGNVTPGYSRVRVWASQECVETRDAGGDFRVTCGPEYLPYVASLVLGPGNTTELLVRLQPVPAPDAVVSGYLVDPASGRALPRGRITFQNEQGGGYGHATTDGDGSFSIRLRSGYHTVTAMVPGFYEWQGTLLVAPGETPFDVELTRAQFTSGHASPTHRPYPDYGRTETCDQYGCRLQGDPYTCYDCAQPMPSMECHDADCAMPSAGQPWPTMTTMPPQTVGEAYPESFPESYPESFPESFPESPAVASGGAYVDLGGRLGPYDAEERKALLGGEAQGRGTPALPLALAVAALALAIVAVRRRL